jgi:hypothetical protein
MLRAVVRAPRRLPLLVLAPLLALGCGYSLVRYGGGLGPVHSVAVRTPRNDSREPGVEYVVADALRREILRRGAPQLVEDPAAADLVLSGRVLPLEAQARAFSSVVLALEYELTLRVELHATRADGSAVDVDSRALNETERYLASADVEAQRKNRDEALRRAASVVASRVYDALAVKLAP